MSDKLVELGVQALSIIHKLRHSPPVRANTAAEPHLAQLEVLVLQMFHPCPQDDTPRLLPPPDEHPVLSFCRSLDFLATEARGKGLPSVAEQIEACRVRVQKSALHS
jgi:hypothetical protein